MNVKLARLIATWCAASVLVACAPISSATALNTPTSSRYCTPTGSPTRSMRRSGSSLNRSGSRSLSNGANTSRPSQSRISGNAVRPITLLSADPFTPSAGAPRLPVISSQLQPALSRLASTTVSTMGRSCPMACSVWRSTTNARPPGKPRIEMCTTRVATGMISAGWCSARSTAPVGQRIMDSGTQSTAASSNPRCSARRTPGVSPAPTAWLTRASMPTSVPMPMTTTVK